MYENEWEGEEFFAFCLVLYFIVLHITTDEFHKSQSIEQFSKLLYIIRLVFIIIKFHLNENRRSKYGVAENEKVWKKMEERQTTWPD
jgi:hypothetical protein